MTAVRERETSVTDASATAPLPHDPGGRAATVPLPIRRTGALGAGEQALVAALLVHGYGRRPADLCAVLAGLATTQP